MNKYTRRNSHKPKFYIQKLAKQKGGRIHNVETYKITCSKSPKQNTAWLLTKQSLKLPNEAMYDEFVHLLKARMNHSDIVVKMQLPGLMASKEQKVLDFFQNNHTPNIVPYICSFTCKDNLNNWMDEIHHSQPFCKGGPDTVQLFLLDYIEHNISDIFHRELNEVIFKSIVTQLGYIYAHTYIEYGFTHGDIHCGNILVDIDTPKINQYVIDNKQYYVDTKGYEPMLIDFQRGMLKHETNTDSRFFSLQNDVSMLYDILAKQSPKYKQRLETVAQDIFMTDNLDEIIQLINSI